MYFLWIFLQLRIFEQWNKEILKSGFNEPGKTPKDDWDFTRLEQSIRSGRYNGNNMFFRHFVSLQIPGHKVIRWMHENLNYNQDSLQQATTLRTLDGYSNHCELPDTPSDE